MALSRTFVVSLLLHGVGLGLAWTAIGGLPGPRARVETTGFFLQQEPAVLAAASPTPVAEMQIETVEAAPLPEVDVVPEFLVQAASLVIEPVELAAESALPAEATLEPWRPAIAEPDAAQREVDVPAGATEPIPVARVLTVRPGTNRAPEYPAAARRRGCTGVVLLAVEVGVDGGVIAVSIERSSGHRVLDDAAVAAVRGWSFDGGPGRIEVPIEFVLRAS